MKRNFDDLKETFRTFLQSASKNSTDQNENITDNLDSDPDLDSLGKLMDEIKSYRATAEIGTYFAVAFTVLGLIILFINLIILAILVSYRRHLFKQVFYLLIINFAIIDCLKGICLASHALRFILYNEDRKVLETRINQYVVIFFRLFNLATVFNLLLITLNEFIYIKFPLRYHQLIRRRFILILVCIGWIISILFTFAASLAKTKEETVLVSIDTNRTKSIRRPGLTSDGTDLHIIFTLTLIGFCLFSLLVVLVCYAVFFNIIRLIQKQDRKLLSDSSLHRSPDEDIVNFDDRRLRRQLLKRYKYVLVIGSVIFVYMLYLISYASIQILQIFNVSRHSDMNAEKMRNMLITRWILVLLCGLHSTIQPICYFRMREFRQIMIRIFGYSCKRELRRRASCGERSDFFSSVADVTPQSTVISNRKYCKHTPPPMIISNHHEENRKIIPSIGKKSYSSTVNGIGSSKGQSFVHFQSGNLSVSTSSRGQFTSRNELL